MPNHGVGPPKGSTNCADGKKFKGAIRKALAKDRTALDRVAKKLIREAEKGSIHHIKELGDRVDGKVPQGIVGANGGPLEILQYDANKLSDLSQEELDTLLAIATKLKG